MAVIIISRRIVEPDGLAETRVAYRARGLGNDYDDFYEWLSNRKSTLTKEWSRYPWHGWEFTNSNDDVAIRLQWADCLVSDPDNYHRHDDLSPVSWHEGGSVFENAAWTTLTLQAKENASEELERRIILRLREIHTQE